VAQQCLSACAKRIKITPLATQEAELYGYAQAARALRFVQMLLEFLWAMPAPPLAVLLGATRH